MPRFNQKAIWAMGVLQSVLLLVAEPTLAGTTAGQEPAERRPSVDEICRQTKCRAPSTVRLGSDIEVALPKAPIAWNGIINLLAGETLYIEADETADGKLANMKVVEKAVKPERTLALKLSQETTKDGKNRFMLFNVMNPFQKVLKYKVHIHPPDKDKFFRTRTCPVLPGRSNHESWPFLIVQLLLSDFHLEEAAKDNQTKCE